MADEQINRIQIAITDGVDPAIAPKIEAIGNASRKSDVQIQSLKQQLASIKGANFDLRDQIASTIINKLSAIISHTKEIAVQAQIANAALIAMDGSSLTVLIERINAVKASLAQLVSESGTLKGDLGAIVIRDEIAPTIAPKILEISAAAKKAYEDVAILQSKLATTTGSGNLTSVVGRTATYSADNTLKSALAAQQLISARKALATATKNLQQAEIDLGNAAASGSKQAQEIINQYRKEAETAAALVAQLKSLRSAYNQAEGGAKKTAEAASHTVTPLIGAQAATRALTGNLTGSVRAAERFLTTTLGLGPVLQAAFPIFGALAMLGILGELIDNVHKLINAFKELDVEQQRSATNAILTGERIIKAKQESVLSVSNLARLIEGASRGPSELNLPNVSVELKQIQMAQEVVKARTAANEQGLQGAAQEKARIEGIKEEIRLQEQQIDVVKNYRDQIKRKLDETQVANGVGLGGGLAGTFQLKTRIAPAVTDPAQRKALQEQLNIATQAVGSTDLKLPEGQKPILGELTTQLDVLKEKLRGAQLALPLKEMKDETKAAREQLKEFATEMGKLEQSGHVVTPQEKLSLLRDQLQRALPENKPKLELQVGNANQEVQRQVNAIEALKERYEDAKTSIGEYSDALREKNAIDKLDLQIKKQGLVLSAEERQGIIDKIKYTIENARYERELKGIYEEFNGPLRQFQAAQKAINTLEAEGAITKQQAIIALNEAKNSYENAINPMKQYQEAWQRETELIGKYGDELEVAIQLQEIEQTLKQKGRILNEQEKQQLTEVLTQLQRQREIQSEVNDMYNQTFGAIQKVTRSVAALNIAKERGIITQERYNVQLAKEKVNLANIAIEMGKFTKQNVLTSVFGSYLKDFEGFTKGITKLWGDVFTTIADGAADSIGRAIVYGENLGDALKDVARQALSQLISGMIKLGVQTLIATVIGKTGMETIKSTSLVAAAELAQAWWVVAEAVSLATFGANAAPAAAGMVSTATLGTILASVAAFKDGGLVSGPMGIDKVLARLSDGEFVMKRDAVQRYGVDTLTAMNNGTSGNWIMPMQNDNAPSNSKVKVEVIHDGSTAIKVVPTDDGRIRVIAKQVAIEAVETHSDRVHASNLRNPNSASSKALKQTKTVREQR